MLEIKTIDILKKAVESLSSKFDLPNPRSFDHLDYSKLEEIMMTVADKIEDNYPYFHPLYAGQMLKPPHPIARAAYMLAMWINPNNHALDGGRASSALEKEVIKDIGAMYEWKDPLGHLTGGGTMANLEALWIAGKLHPDKVIVASDQAHYTHNRISEVLQLKFEKIKSDENGLMDLNQLEDKLKMGNIGTVVVTMGTTGLGTVDPLKDILELQKRYSFRIHADCAYGGYFMLAGNLRAETRQNFDSLNQVDSIVIDPHKHGLQPYGCGCILFRENEVSKYYLHDSPYTYYSSDEVHLGEISLECSRPGAAAVGLWATHQMLPPIKGGEFAGDMNSCREAALELYQRLEQDERFIPVMQPELDIVVWAIKANNTEKMSKLAKSFFNTAEKKNLYLSLYNYPADNFEKYGIEVNSKTVSCLRSCLLKPEHNQWMNELWKRIEMSY